MSLQAVMDYKNVTRVTVPSLLHSFCARYHHRMSSESTASLVRRALEDSGLDAETIGNLASSLVWRIGRLSDESPVTVRVGSTQGLQQFSELPRLRNASDQEIEEALSDGSLRVEWVGPRL